VQGNHLTVLAIFALQMLGSYFKRKFRKAVTSVYDPLVPLQIGNQTIQVNLSHQLSQILGLYPNYNFNLARIVSYVEKYYGQINVIDIGANVGDTVAFIRNYSKAPILCIDGEDNYVRLLRRNTAQYQDVAICQTLVGTETKTENFKLKVTQGTAHIEESSNVTSVRTLEHILDEFTDFKNAKILKSDTDGFDTHILRASKDFILRAGPILFFEFDPHFIRANGDDPFSFIDYLRGCGYRYFMCYTNVGDYLLSCTAAEQSIMDDLIHYYSGRKIDIFMDICAFMEDDKAVYEKCREAEIAHFKAARHY
jgi:FkbM family methyltransferase